MYRLRRYSERVEHQSSTVQAVRDTVASTTVCRLHGLFRGRLAMACVQS